MPLFCWFNIFAKPMKRKSSERYTALFNYLEPAYNVPEFLFEECSTNDASCVFLVSCLNADRIIFMEDSFELLTGYPIKSITKAGMDFWFPLIHPEDLPIVMEKIIQSHEIVLKPGFDKKQLVPLILEYRFKNADGEWHKIRDTKYLLMADDEFIIDKILCRFDLLDSTKDVTNVEDLVKQNKSCTKMLEFALLHKNAQRKQLLPEQNDIIKTIVTSPKPQLTKREKEILLLIGEGLSTKMIADKCKISINTVETHRRHLLEKLQAKNSMELIKEASKIFWL